MANIKTAYGSGGTSLGVGTGLNSLGSGSGYGSDAVSNTSNNYLDALVQVTAKTGSSGTSSTGYISVYAYGSVDSGTTYTDGFSGSHGSVTPVTARLIGTFAATANSTTYTSPPMSVAAGCGGILPDNWGVFVVNNAGAALSSSGSSAEYEGIYETAV